MAKKKKKPLNTKQAMQIGFAHWYNTLPKRHSLCIAIQDFSLSF